MRHDVKALLALALMLLLGLAACGNTPKPFEHDGPAPYRPKRDTAEVTIETPANMPDKMAERLAAALAIELQAYGVVAALQPSRAPLRLSGAMTTRDAPLGSGIEVEVEWYLLGDGKPRGPVVSKTTTQPNDYAEASDWLVSRIAQQAAPRVASLMGKSQSVDPRSIGAVAAGVTAPGTAEPTFGPEAPASVTAAAASAAGAPAASAASGGKQAAPATPPAPQVKVMVAPVTGAPSDGNKQLFSGMRRALGSSKVVVIDAAGADTFTVTGTVVLTPVDERTAQLSVKWTLKDPKGREVGNIEQANPVPAAATRGSWAGFGDIVAAAAVEGVLELLDKALSAPR